MRSEQRTAIVTFPFSDKAALHRENFIAITDRVDGLTDTENAWFTLVADAGHEYSAWIVGLYNFLQVVFMM